MKKCVSLLLAVLLVATLFTGCAPKKKTTVKIGVIAGSAGIGMVGLMAKDEAETTKNDYSFTVIPSPSPNKIISKLSSGDVDIVTMPTNLAAILNKKIRGDARVLAVNTLGDLSILENGGAIKSMTDLKGKTIYTTELGTNADYVLKYILRKNGIDPDVDVKIEYLLESGELSTKIINEASAVAMVSEPTATALMLNSSNIRKALDMTTEWKKVSNGSQLITGCVVTTREFIESHKDAVNTFLKEYKTSVDAALRNTESTAVLCEKYKIISSVAIAKKVIPNSNLVYSDGDEMKATLSKYLKTLYTSSKNSVAGVLPDDKFYYKK